MVSVKGMEGLELISNLSIMDIACRENRKWGVHVDVDSRIGSKDLEKEIANLIIDLPTGLYGHLIDDGQLAMFHLERDAREIFHMFNIAPFKNSEVKAYLISPVCGVHSNNMGQ